ncbi:MAG TPA: nuclease A inhibitor family protein [Chitinophagaceae bacterium]|nr:nuclease A inhibitor family protein [Chitinophagaceae bacterium]
MHPDLQLIKEASDGLLYVSESDYPFEAVEFGEFTSIEEKIIEITGQDPKVPVEKVTLEYFLRHMTRVDAEGPENQRQTAQRFIHLQQLLLQKLKDVVVYRLGTVQVDVFIMGRSTDNHYIGLRTKSIET